MKYPSRYCDGLVEDTEGYTVRCRNEMKVLGVVITDSGPAQLLQCKDCKLVEINHQVTV